MELVTIDYVIIAVFFAAIVSIGIVVSKRAGKNSKEFFLSGRNMPWWLLGFSMVATTFSTDTPNFVTNVVREDGVSGNWIWWAFLLTGLLTVFVYAKLWRRSNVTTDMEFYELRYGGKPAAFLRGFRAIYLGIGFNIIAMAAVSLAAIKIGQVMLGFSALEVIGVAGTITVIFSALGGFRGVLYTDFLLFFVAMGGAIGAAIYIVNMPEVGGLTSLLEHANVHEKIDLLPRFDQPEALIGILIIPLAVQWWSAWYPGAEPGGGGYIAQRMLAAKNENHAVGATFFFNIMHYALRPWPWIVVALASLVVYPDINSLQEAFPNVAQDKLGHDLAYSAMLTHLPAGLLGLVLASLGAAYMSTISTHLNWGSSYIVNDFYQQHVNPKASEKELVFAGRFSTILLMVASSGLALILQDAKQLFEIILMFGAGTGLIFLLRWFWWRINAWSEIVAMFASGTISLLIHFTPVGASLFGAQNIDGQIVTAGFFPEWAQYPFVVAITTVCWVATTLFTTPEKSTTLYRFYQKTQPGGPGWKKVRAHAKQDGETIVTSKKSWNLPYGIAATALGTVVVFGCLFATGNYIYGQYVTALWISLVVLIFGLALILVWRYMKRKLI